MTSPALIFRALHESTPMQMCDYCPNPATYRCNTRTMFCRGCARRVVHVLRRFNQAFITVQCDELTEDTE